MKVLPMSDNTSEGGLKNKVAKGTMWVALEQFVVQGLNFGMGILLARLLGPEAFGTVALVAIFIAVAQVLAISGLGQALVQKADSDDEDFNAVFCASIAVASFLYAVLFLLAPVIARFYNVAELTAVVRVLALNLFCFSFNSVQNAALFKKMRFDVTFRVSIVTAVVSAAVGVGMAFCGFGVWALVWSSVLSNVAGVFARMFYIDWHPHFRCDFGRMKPLFSFGWKLMASSLLATFVSNINGVMIGKFFSKADLAFVNRGKNIPELIGNNIRVSLIESSFPAMAQLGADRDRMALALHRMLAVAMFVLLPLMVALAIVAERLVLLLYGNRWMACIPYIQLACIGNLFWTAVAVSTNAVMALGRSDWLLKAGIAINVLSFGVMCACLPFGVLPWMMAGTFVTAPTALVLDIVLVRKLVDFGFRSQFKDILPSLLLTLAMAVAMSAVGLLPFGESVAATVLILSAQGAVAVVVYVSLAFALRIRALGEILKIVAPKLPKRMPFRSRVLGRFEMDEKGVAV